MLEPNSALWIFILETHVNQGVDNFMLGSSLFDSDVSPRHNIYYGPLGIRLSRRDSLHTTLSDWVILYSTITRYAEAYYGQATQHVVKHRVDWIEARDDYDPA